MFFLIAVDYITTGYLIFLSAAGFETC